MSVLTSPNNKPLRLTKRADADEHYCLPVGYTIIPSSIGVVLLSPTFHADKYTRHHDDVITTALTTTAGTRSFAILQFVE